MSEWFLDELRDRSKREGKSLTEYVENVIEEYWDSGYKGKVEDSPINLIFNGPVVGNSATSEHHRLTVDDLDLGMEELHEDKEPMIEYNDDYSQGRVVGRHKK